MLSDRHSTLIELLWEDNIFGYTIFYEDFCKKLFDSKHNKLNWIRLD